MLSRLAITHGEPADALDYLTLAIRNFYDSGSFFLLLTARWPSSPPFSTGSDATNRPPPSPVSPLNPLTAAAVP